MAGPFHFAWSGGAIQEQVTIVTSGNTHGGQTLTVTLVGNLEAGSQMLTGIASNSGLEQGDFYTLAGPGIVEGTYFLHDDSSLSGPPDTILLSSAATQTLASTTLVATKSIPLATAVATMALGSNVLSFGTLDLAAGTYGVIGTGIGHTEIPTGADDSVTGVVESAYMLYDGAGSGEMYKLVATPGEIPEDETEPVEYTVAVQEVTATTTGDFSVAVSGPPSGDWYSITGVPSSVFLSLYPGLRYNITGNGVPVGTTFIAPAGGSTSIIIDLPATTSQVGAILTITGPRTPNEPFNPAVHNRFDEEIIGFDIAHDEGAFASLTIDIKNPAIGLLALGRNLWCWLSWDRAWPDGAPDLVPLFNGRLIGVPKLQADEIVQLEFLARPDDFNSQKAALVESLQVLPYYDPIWLAAERSADTVLEAYSALFHIDPVSLAVTISDVLQGEAGIVEVGEDVAFYDGFSLSYGQPPLVAVTISGTVSWQQQATGIVDVTGKIIEAFDSAAAAPYGGALPVNNTRSDTSGGGGGLVQELNDGLIQDWPKPGTTIGGGWRLSNQLDDDGVPLCYCVTATANNKGGWIEEQFYEVSYGNTESWENAEEEVTDLDVFLKPVEQWRIDFPIMTLKIRMTLDYRADRTRTETVTAVLAAGVQQVLSDSAEEDREEIALTSTYVGEAVDPGGEVPIGNVAYRSYFQTDRGASSFEYLLLMARAKMRARARAVDLTFACAWREALPITLRHSVLLFDRRLPGGSATGKVKSVGLSMRDGVMLGEFTIGCTIGTGDPSVPVEGVNSYVADGYSEGGWQVVAGGQVALLPDELAYETLDQYVIDDDGLDLARMTADSAVNFCTVVNGLETQLRTLAEFQDTVAPTRGDPLTEARRYTTRVTLDLKPVQGSEFHTDFYPAVSRLALPKTIDLEASGGSLAARS